MRHYVNSCLKSAEVPYTFAFRVTDQVSGSLEAASTEKAEQYELEEGEYLSDSD